MATNFEYLNRAQAARPANRISGNGKKITRGMSVLLAVGASTCLWAVILLVATHI